MAKLTEIRWHGRGGQGAKTAALLFGEAVLGQGKHMQAFPEYGPERMGAPVQSFNRISEEPITLHCHVTNPAGRGRARPDADRPGGRDRRACRTTA